MPISVPITPTITAAGLAAIFNAQSTGVEFELSHIAFGIAQYVPNGTEEALRTEKVRVPIAGGGRISPTQIQIYALAMAMAGDPFFVGEIGFFGDDGATLLAVYSSLATPNLFLSDTVATSISYALGLEALPANSVTVTIDPSASAALLIIGQHVASADPHPQYVKKVNGVAFYDPDLAFNLGAEIIGDDLLVYQSAQANNVGHPPSSSPAWWVPLYNYGDTPVAGLTNASVTLTSTQAARAHITFSGALTAPINVIFPNWVKEWTVVNKTTGAVALICKTAAGTGIAIPQNGSPTKIYGDGTNITQLPENIAPAVAANQAVQLGQVSGVVGQTRNLVSSVVTASATKVVTADEIIVETALGGLRFCLSSINLTGNLATQMDTGTAPASGFVAEYVIYNPNAAISGTNPRLLYTNATSAKQPEVYGGANMPAGYTASALVSVWPTNASALFSIANQVDRSLSYPLLAGVVSSAPFNITSFSIAGNVPPNAKDVNGAMALAMTSNGTVNVAVYENAAACGQQNNNYGNGANIGSSSSSTFRSLRMQTPQTIYFSIAISAGGTISVNISTTGYSI